MVLIGRFLIDIVVTTLLQYHDMVEQRRDVKKTVTQRCNEAVFQLFKGYRLPLKQIFPLTRFMKFLPRSFCLLNSLNQHRAQNLSTPAK